MDRRACGIQSIGSQRASYHRPAGPPSNWGLTLQENLALGQCPPGLRRGFGEGKLEDAVHGAWPLGRGFSLVSIGKGSQALMALIQIKYCASRDEALRGRVNSDRAGDPAELEKGILNI